MSKSVQRFTSQRGTHSDRGRQAQAACPRPLRTGIRDCIEHKAETVDGRKSTAMLLTQRY